ncbi:MAG: SGNH/GDSL hydrolase family protein [Planctomycetota bacterium]
MTLARATRAIALFLAATFAAMGIVADELLGGEPGFGSAQRLLVLVGVGLALTSLLPAVWALRSVLVVAGAGLGILLFEVPLQLFFKPHFTTIYQLDPHLLLRLVPGSSMYNRRLPVNGGPRNGGRGILMRVNSQGFRGEELEPRPAGKRIVVYGDSFILADFSELENTFVEQLEGKLETALGEAIEVINAGVNSYGPDQISLRLEQEIPCLQPDLVLVSLYAGNDLGDLLRNKIFRLDSRGDLVINRYVLAAPLVESFRRAQRGLITYRLVREVLNRWKGGEGELDRNARRYRAHFMESALADCEREFLELPNDNLNGRASEVSDLFMDHYDADLALDPRGRSSQYKMRLMEQVVTRMKSTAESLGVSVLLLLIPHPIDVCDGYDLAQVDPARFPEYERSQLTDVLVRIALRQGVPYVNLFPEYRARDANELYFHGGNDHWNDAGQELAAEIVKDFILSHELWR